VAGTVTKGACMPVNISRLSPLLCWATEVSTALRAALLSPSARGKEVGCVGLLQLGHLARLKEFMRNWTMGGFGPLLHSRELKDKTSKVI